MRPIIYAKVSRNRIHFRNIQTGMDASVAPETAFTTVRLLVGEFPAFQACMKKGLEQVHKKGILATAPTIIVQAMEMNEGGLCDVERRILQEATEAAGATQAIVHEGAALSDQEAARYCK